MTRAKKGGRYSGGIAKSDHYKAQLDKALRQMEQVEAQLNVAFGAIK
jgi:hypothetical protein